MLTSVNVIGMMYWYYEYSFNTTVLHVCTVGVKKHFTLLIVNNSESLKVILLKFMQYIHVAD